MRISKTGIAKGSGSDRFRYVSGLSAEDKAAVVKGETVIVKRNAHNQNRYGLWYVVTKFFTQRGIRFGHRLPTPEEQKEIDSI